MAPSGRSAQRMLAVALAASLWGSAIVPAGASTGDGVEGAQAADTTTTAKEDRSSLTAADPAGRVLVWWRPGTSASARVALVGPASLRLALTEDIDAIDVGRDRTAELIAVLENRAEVEAVSVDRAIEIAATPPDDPLFPMQWGLENTGALVLDGRPGRAGVDIRGLGAWELTRGDASVTVAVVDTGIDLDHPDLAGALWRNPGETVDGLDSDGNGLVDDVHGWDFVADRSTIYQDPVGDRHGTQVAGIIAARADDGFGITGVAPEVEVMALKAFATDPITGAGQGSLSTVVPALLYAAEHGADVINASWVTSVDEPLLREVVSRAGVPVVAAAGNGDRTGRGMDLSAGGRVYPASYDLPNLITVTALDHQGLVPAFANRGASTVHLGAPGTDVLSIKAGGGHTSGSGTSFAAAFVSGAIALAASVAPYATTADLVDALEYTTRFETGLVGLTTTGGMVDAAAVVRGVQRPVCRADLQRPSSFEDVPLDGVHTTSIDCLVAQEVTRGRDPATFAPSGSVTRGQMATFLTRVLDREGVAVQTPVTAPEFEDVDDHPHGAAIARLAELGVVHVGADRRFRPEVPVTRGQAASLLDRTYAVATGDGREPTRAWFTDTADSVHAESIARARDLGIVRGTDRVQYAPGERLRRDQMASVLARLLDALERGRAADARPGGTGM